MDPLLLTAGTTLVTAMATDGWKDVRAAAAALWHRIHPERVSAVEAELLDVRNEIMAARTSGDVRVEAELATEWQRKLGRLLTTDPTLEASLRTILKECWAPALSADDSARVWHIVQTATVSGSGRVFQAGRDQYNNGV
ncbi:hypothetical protein [Nocardia aurantia]|uniref:Uncharacterized protein n=1 Tax=Nocardia aurantia TaxID=2585199 RepID=A0A7K0DKW8_9NOCA|nr:hypothetical protein [Nocardia aurantia]MQY26328.1 hypothetical protein [Nocardia aurantia]